VWGVGRRRARQRRYWLVSANLTTAYEHSLIERVNRHQRMQQATSPHAEHEGRERPPRGQARAPTA
jgi:hypothetical protein